MDKDKCGALLALEEVIKTLTGPDGCPWDKTQTPQTMADYVIEESHELAAAIREGKSEEICKELGDVAFLILFIADYFEKQGLFNLADALNGNRMKMVRRHPHVFAGEKFANLEEQLKAWEAIKKSEAKEPGAGIFASLPRSLPPLVKAYRIHSKAARAGFTWEDDEQVEQQVESEWLEWLDAAQARDEGGQKHELGDMLFSLVELGRRKGIKANDALDMACSRFLKRFCRMEQLARESGRDFEQMSLEEKDELWNQAKTEEKPGNIPKD